MIIQDIQNREDLVLVTNSQDTEEIRQSLAHLKNVLKSDSFFAKIQDGDYVELYGFEGIIPLQYKTLIKII